VTSCDSGVGQTIEPDPTKRRTTFCPHPISCRLNIASMFTLQCARERVAVTVVAAQKPAQALMVAVPSATPKTRPITAEIELGGSV